MNNWAIVAIFLIVIFLSNIFMNNKIYNDKETDFDTDTKKTIILIIRKSIYLPKRNTLFT